MRHLLLQKMWSGATLQPQGSRLRERVERVMAGQGTEEKGRLLQERLERQRHRVQVPQVLRPRPLTRGVQRKRLTWAMLLAVPAQEAVLARHPSRAPCLDWCPANVSLRSCKASSR